MTEKGVGHSINNTYTYSLPYTCNYDTSAPINPDCLSTIPAQKNVLFHSLGSAIESSIVWDSVYFVRIAEYGYEYEQTYAFFPLLHLCMSFLSRTGVVLCVSVLAPLVPVLAPLVPVIGQRAVLGLSGYVINNIGFVFAAVYLYRLRLSSALYCRYSETLFVLFSVGGLYHLISGKDVIAVLWFALSGFSRFNGVLNAGYFCFQTMHQAYDAVFLRKRPFAVVGGALLCICIFVPFIAFQAYGYNNLCLGHLPSDMRPWCNARLPNFLLASPILSLALCSIVHYAKSNPENFFSLGFRAPLEDKDSAAVLFSLAEYSSRSQGFTFKQPLLCDLTYYYCHCFIAYSVDVCEATCNQSFANVTENRTRKQVNKDGPALLPEEHKNTRIHRPTPLSGKRLCSCCCCYTSASILCILKALDNLVQFQHSFMKLWLSMTRKVFFQRWCEDAALRSEWHNRLVITILVFSLCSLLVLLRYFSGKVATRFLSFSPPLYWFASYIMKSRGTGKRWGYIVWAYSAAYILLGSLLFSNFYPFT
ncbi:hypothetical protein DVH24_038039 [Malus domestica]|uniref:GPI mannosyltransferase 2 n=1 Tax=Malus domestica TaxID=3750 RepID=A0A498KD66_MALDO|nr:hypothetical protein DVH24_038039 [Malus domestica]